MARLPVMIFVACGVALGSLTLVSTSTVRLPGNDQGYSPRQPIAFSHRLHAGELAIDCLHCHGGAEKSPHAGIPPASLCMNCHSSVKARKDAVDAEVLAAKAESRSEKPVVSGEIRKIWRSLALDDDLKPLPGAESRPLEWVRVHDLPDFAWFDHRPHVGRGIACQSCHGPVEAMERVRQVATLSMGWCVECHRINTKEGKGALEPGLGHARAHDHVTTDCSTCHF